MYGFHCRCRRRRLIIIIIIIIIIVIIIITVYTYAPYPGFLPLNFVALQCDTQGFATILSSSSTCNLPSMQPKIRSASKGSLSASYI